MTSKEIHDDGLADAEQYELALRTHGYYHEHRYLQEAMAEGEYAASLAQRGYVEMSDALAELAARSARRAAVCLR